MNISGRSEFDPSFLKTALTEGLKDSINPYAFACVLIFIVILSCLGRTSSRVFFFGALFILTSAFITFTTLMGEWDKIMTDPPVVNGVRVAYVILAVFFVLIGSIDLIDWGRHKKSGDLSSFRLSLPVFFREHRAKVDRRFIMKFLLFIGAVATTVVVSAIASLMGTIAPQSEFVFIVHSTMIAGGDKDFVNKCFLLYSFSAVLIMIVAWVKIWWLASKKRQSTRAPIYYKLVLSAIFLSTGISLGIFCLN